MSPRVVAVVPARAGSQRLPGKNRLLLEGRSLFDRAIDGALDAPSIDVVVATTDDPDLLAGEPRDRVTVLDRPARLADSHATTVDVVLDVLDRTGDPEIVVLLQPTSPLRLPADIDACVRELDRAPASCGSVVTVCANEHPVEWVFDHVDGELRPVFGWDATTGRSQDKGQRFRLNGAVYAVRSSALRSGAGFVGPGSRMVEMPSLRSVDIDVAADFEIAAALLRSGLIDGAAT